MAEISSNDLAIIRSGSQYSRWGMLVFRAPIIATATVSGSPSVGATTISLSGYSATDTVNAYYTVIAGSSSGNDDGGKVRLKSVNGGGSSITVASNNIEWSDYTYVCILREILPWTILPDLGNDYMDENVPYSNQNSQYRPLGRIGPPAWGYAGQPIKFYADSLAYDSSAKVMNGNNVASHSWSFPNGTPSSSSSSGNAANPIEVTWSTTTGHVPEYVRYTVTDNNGNTHTRYNPVWIIDEFGQDMYCDIDVESVSGDYGSGGWEARVKVRSEATSSDFPSDAMIMIVAEDWYNGVKASIGGNWTHREDVLFVGWIVRGTTFKNADTGYVAFEAVGAMGKANQMTDWPANLTDTKSPFAWNQLLNMTCDMAAYHIITERTTLDHIVDINPTGNSKLLKYVDIPETSIQTQLDDYCLSPVGARALSDRQSQIYFSRNPNLRPISERTGIANICEVELTDIRSDPGLELAVEEQEKVVAQVDFIGFTYSGLDVNPLYSLAPERQYHTGRVEKVDGIRADNQNEANVLSGLYLANFNNIWTQVRWPMFNMRIFDIVPEEYALFSLTATDTERGIVWNSQKLIPRSIDFSLDAEKEAIEVDVILEKDSFGPPGVGGGYATEPPRRSASPQSAPEQAGLALATWGSWYIRKQGDAEWTARGDVDVTSNGCVDPWWFIIEKQNTFDPDFSILYNIQDGGVLQRSKNGGFTWQSITLTTLPNTWSDVIVVPDIDDMTMQWISGDDHQNGRFYILAEWMNSTNNYRAWMCVTDDDFATHTWYPLYDGVSLPTDVRPLGVRSNHDNVLVTVWIDGELELQVYDPVTIGYNGKHSLGDCTASQLGDTYTAYPVTVWDEPEEWFVFGRMNTPQSLSNPSHIIRYVNGTWSEVESSWGTYICGSFYASRKDSNGKRKFYAVKNT